MIYDYNAEFRISESIILVNGLIVELMQHISDQFVYCTNGPTLRFAKILATQLLKFDTIWPHELYIQLIKI